MRSNLDVDDPIDADNVAIPLSRGAQRGSEEGEEGEEGGGRGGRRGAEVLVLILFQPVNP